jgi:flagellar L-ring protein FlgH
MSSNALGSSRLASVQPGEFGSSKLAIGIARSAAAAVLRKGLVLTLAVCTLSLPAHGMLGLNKKKQQKTDYLADYIQRVKTTMIPQPTTGSIWTPQSPYSDLASDYKARNINDLIVIEVTESTTAAEDGLAKTARTYNASSGISALFGNLGPNNALQNLFSPNSSQTLNGQSQTSSDASLTTNVSGRVVDVLPNGFLVVEAERKMYMNNQYQTLVIHGVVRPNDIGSNNAVPSTSISNLEVELKGHGVISDGVAPPNKLVRLILKLVGF